MSESDAVRTGRIARAAPLVGLAGRTAGEAVVASLGRRVRGGDTARSADFHARTAERYAEALGRSKGVLMKAGQILSFTSMAPMLGEDNASIYQRALARLQDDAPPMPAAMAAKVVQSELGAPPDEVFADFDAEPFAAASIGQVHGARTRDGRDVVVKIQYPGVDEAIRNDLRNTELLATFFQLIRGVLPEMSRIDARTVAREVSARIGEEIDYRTEAANQTLYADAYRGHPFIRIPEVLPELSTARVLTMQRAHGLRYAEAVHAEQRLRDLWGEVIERFSFGSMRRLHVFHADPHPGNYLFHDDGSVTFLDFGCVKQLTAERIGHIRGLIDAVVAGDAEATLAAFIALGMFDAADPPDAERVLAWYREALASLLPPQPFTYTPEWAANLVRTEMSPYGPYGDVVRRASLAADDVLLTRIDLGLSSVLAGLRPTGPWEAIRQEFDHAGPPATPFGELDQSFWAAAQAAQSAPHAPAQSS